MVREMKDSGVEWIGEIPAEWETIELKRAFCFLSGDGFPISLQGEEEGDIPFYKAGDISQGKLFLGRSRNYITYKILNRMNFTSIPAGAIVFPKIGMAMHKNSRAILSCMACLDNNCQAAVPKDGIISEFAYYVFVSIDMGWFDNGGPVPAVNNLKLGVEHIAIPGQREQRTIANYLDSKCAVIDELTANIEAQITKLDEYKKSLITQAVTKGLDPDV